MVTAREEAIRFLENHALSEPFVASLKQAWPTRFGLMDIG